MGVQISFPLLAIAFICELVDSSLGMGYGTTLTPILLLLGFSPLEVVPAVLFSEFLTGISAGLFHHGFGNVDLRLGGRDFKVTVRLISSSIIGVSIAAFAALRLPEWLVKVYIGILVLVMGVVILRNSHKQIAFSWRRISGLGFLAAFNKGISGGGYGPVVTGGQVLSGIKSRNAIGIASLSEGVTSLIGLMIYLAGGIDITWSLLLSLSIGALLSVPLSAYVVSRISHHWLTAAIGGFSAALGGYILFKLVI